MWGPVNKTSLVSKGCSLIRVPKCKIYENLNITTTKKLRFCAMTEAIPDDPELGETTNILWCCKSPLLYYISETEGVAYYISQNIYYKIYYFYAKLILAGRETISRMLWSDAVGEIGKQVFKNQQHRKTAQHFVQAATCGWSLQNKG